MSHNDDNSGMLYIGGIVVIVVVVGLLIKVLKAIMVELSLLFTAICKAASAFMTMAWQIALVLCLLALGMAAIYAAWIFSKKYYQLVKDATHVKEQIEKRFSYLNTEFNTSFKNLKRDAIRDIMEMRKELDEALKRSEVVPDVPQISQMSADASSISTEITTTEGSSELVASTATQSTNELTAQEKPQMQDTPKDISNPF